MKTEIRLVNNQVMKDCSKCNEIKPLSESFYMKRTKGRVVFNARCKDCERQRNNTRRENNKEICRERNRKYYKNNKDLFREYWFNNKDKKSKNNKVYRLKTELGGRKLNRGTRALRNRK